ncbi:MAG: response regulator [Verrucomicrobia bacterium]|jgi:CheY-like chemotaxis protein|nr:response regulator [Verrucomicrobiota bacterium]
MPRILVIDDNDAFRTTICLWLKRHGYEVLEASNGKVGMQVLTSSQPDIVLTDILMPEQDGLETIQAVRKQQPNLRIIAMSGGMLDGRVDFLPIAAKFGADHVMPKPFSGSELLLVLEKVLASNKNG